jgi:hypothetical protein
VSLPSPKLGDPRFTANGMPVLAPDDLDADLGRLDRIARVTYAIGHLLPGPLAHTVTVARVAVDALDVLPVPPRPAVDDCPNLYLSDHIVQIHTPIGWINVHPGPPPCDGAAYLTAETT